MSEILNYKNPPIREAILDFRVKSAGEAVEKLESYKIIQNLVSLPISTPISEHLSSFNLSEKHEIKTDTKSRLLGYKYSSEDNKYVVQFRSNGFTYSRVNSYDNWGNFSREAKVLWDEYVKIMQPGDVTRIATRFINIINLPYEDKLDFSDYLRAPPAIPPGVSQDLSSFLTRVVISNNDINASCILTQALERFDDKTVPITLDIDAFINKSFNTNDQVIWEDFKKLRIFKNQIFENSLTDKTKGLFK